MIIKSHKKSEEHMKRSWFWKDNARSL